MNVFVSSLVIWPCVDFCMRYWLNNIYKECLTWCPELKRVFLQTVEIQILVCHKFEMLLSVGYRDSDYHTRDHKMYLLCMIISENMLTYNYNLWYTCCLLVNRLRPLSTSLVVIMYGYRCGCCNFQLLEESLNRNEFSSSGCKTPLFSLSAWSSNQLLLLRPQGNKIRAQLYARSQELDLQTSGSE